MKSQLFFRGQRNRGWLLDSTFARSLKKLLDVPEGHGFKKDILDSTELHFAFLNLYLLKFLHMVGPSDELISVGIQQGVDPYFELLKRWQQYPDEDLAPTSLKSV